MAHVVAEPCLGCKYTDCVVVCPVDCFRDGRSMLYIHPLECIDCAACVAACPARAIFHEDELPEDWIPYRDLNATMARQLARVTSAKSPTHDNQRRIRQSAGLGPVPLASFVPL